MRIIDYIKQFDHVLISPIWGGKQAFHFLCLGHLDISQALGFELEQITPVLTIVKENQLKTLEELKAHMENHSPDYELLKGEASYISSCKEEYPGELCGGGCFGPLTVVSGILGAERMLRMTVKQPELVETFVAYVTEYLMELARLEAAQGQDFFWIAEPVASLLTPARFWRFSGQYLKKIYEAAEAPGFLHVCGKTIKHTQKMVETGAEVLSIDYCTDIGECIRMVDEHVVIMGNISPITLRHGSPKDVQEEVRHILDCCKGYPNLILSTGCSIMPGTSEENMEMIFRTAEEYQR